MFSLENRDETIMFMSRYFDETKTILILILTLMVNGEFTWTLTQLSHNAWSDFFFKHMLKVGGGKHVKVKKLQRQDILRLRADARKLILGSIGNPS